MQKPALTRTISVMTAEPVKKTAESVLKSIPDSKIKKHDNQNINHENFKSENLN